MKNSAHTLVLVRHGQSLWNQENRFTGWMDIDLSPQGQLEAKSAGEILKKEGLTFDLAHTSVLKRAIRTLWTVLDTMDLMWIPVHRSWRLNERHYGNLQGLNKSEMAEKFGEKQVQIWRRSYDIPPPPMELSDARSPSKDPRYASLKPQEIPLAESLKLTVERFLPYWENTLVPTIQSGKKTLIVAHGNSLRALVKHLDQVSDADITEMNIPTGVPLVYELDSDLKPLSHRYLGDPEAIRKAQEAVAHQGKKR